MQERMRKKLSEQELAAQQRSEDAMGFYVGAVTEIQTYRQEADKITAWHEQLNSVHTDKQLKEGVEKLHQRTRLWALEKSALNTFNGFRDEWLKNMLPEHRQQMLEEVDPRIGYVSTSATTSYGALFSSQSADSSARTKEQAESGEKNQSGWGCTVQ